MVRDTAALTASSLLIRLMTMAMQAYLAAKVGASGIALCQLSGSVVLLFAAVAVSGMRFSSTRLVAEEISVQTGGNVPGAMRSCFGYASVFGAVSFIALFLTAEPLSFLWVGDARTVLSLRIAAFGMPFMAYTSVFVGYFTAVGAVPRAAVIQLAEQACSVILTILFLNRAVSNDIAVSCASITAAGVISSVFGTMLLYFSYLSDRSKWRTHEIKSSNTSRRLFSIAAPLAVTAYVKTSLGTAEHLWIPRGLRLFGYTSEAALAGYGAVHGMALPAVLFPACLLFSLAEIIVPRLTLLQARDDIDRIRRWIRRLLFGTLLYACLSSAIVYGLSGWIANEVFHTAEAAKYIRRLALLMPVMNMDTIADACLRGLGRQSTVMWINILDAALGVALVWILIPGHGIDGYLWMIWITECVNCLLSVHSLQRSLNRKAPFRQNIETALEAGRIR